MNRLLPYQLFFCTLLLALTAPAAEPPGKCDLSDGEDGLHLAWSADGLKCSPAEQRRPSPGDTTYHIDPVAGDDRHAGTARDAAWKSFHPLNRLTLAAGDRVEILAPGSFDQTLTLAGAGTAAKPIEVRFAPGRYDFHPAHAHREAYQISNTNDDPEGLKAVAILLDGAKHLRLSGAGASVICRGKMIQVCVDECEDVVISGLTFDYHRPTVSEFRVVEHGDDHVDLAIHEDSHYSIEDGKITWLGEGWSKTTGLAQELDPESGIVLRGKHAVSAKSTQGLRVTGNSIQSDAKAEGDVVITRDCQDVIMEDNRIMPEESQ